MKTPDPAPAAAHPLWTLVAVLGEIAARVERRLVEENSSAGPKENAAGGEPAAQGEAA